MISKCEEHRGTIANLRCQFGTSSLKRSEAIMATILVDYENVSKTDTKTTSRRSAYKGVYTIFKKLFSK